MIYFLSLETSLEVLSEVALVEVEEALEWLKVPTLG